MKLKEGKRGMYLAESESDIQKRIAQILILKGYLVIRFNSGAARVGTRYIRFYQIMNNNHDAGLPDLAAMKNGGILFIEVKSQGGRVRSSQKSFKELADRYGIQTLITSNWEQVLEYVNHLQ